MPFLTKLSITAIRGTNIYMLNKPLHYFSNQLSRLFVVPEGTKTDFASIPSFIKFWIDDDGGSIRDAAVVHDYLYSNKSNVMYSDIDRKSADGVIIEGMEDLNASYIKRRAVYYALRLFGSFAYKKDEV